MRRLIPITLAALAIALSGCGYSLRTSRTPSLLSKKGVRRIYVRPMTNGTFRPGVENIVFNALVRAINGSPELRAAPTIEQADAELLGNVSRVERNVGGLLKAADLNPKGLGSPNILVATEYVAVLGCDFTLRTIEGRGVPVEVLWKGGLSRSKPFPANNQLWSLGSTSALINESELERSLGDVAEQMGRDAVQSMLEDF